MLKYASYILKKLAKEGDIFDYTPNKAYNDRDFAMEIVGLNPNNYSRLEEHLKEDAEIAMLGLKNAHYSNFIDEVPESLRSDKKFMLEASKYIYLSFEHLEGDLKYDKELCLICLRDGDALYNILDYNTLLRDDEEFLFEAIMIEKNNLGCVDDKYKDNKEFILKILDKKKIDLEDLSKCLKEDKEIIHAVVKRDYILLGITIFHDDTELQQYTRGISRPFYNRHKKFIRDMPCDIYIHCLLCSHCSLCSCEQN